jgi:hypothetical protein
MTTNRAVSVGVMWVNGAVLVAMVVPILLGGAFGALISETRPALGVGLIFGAILAGFVLGWLSWSSQVVRWRLWAYRRVHDVEALKVAAVEAKLIWPEGHLFERTEFRSRDDREEMARLESASRARVLSGVPAAITPPTNLGTLGKALFLGLAFTPLCILAPAGALNFFGVDVTSSPLFLGLLAAFPAGLTGLIYWKARRDGVEADEAMRRLLPRGIRSEETAD